MSIPFNFPMLRTFAYCTDLLLRLSILNNKALEETKKYYKKSLIAVSKSYAEVRRFAIALTLLSGGRIEEVALSDLPAVESAVSGMGNEDYIFINAVAGSNAKAISAIVNLIKNKLDGISDKPLDDRYVAHIILYTDTFDKIPPEFADIAEGISFDYSLYKNDDYLDTIFDVLNDNLDPYYSESDYDDEDEDYYDEDEEYEDDDTVSYAPIQNYSQQPQVQKLEFEDEFAQRQQAMQEAQIRAAREAAKAPIRAQIAALKAERAKLETENIKKYGLKINSPDRFAIKQYDAQIAELEKQLNNL